MALPLLLVACTKTVLLSDGSETAITISAQTNTDVDRVTTRSTDPSTYMLYVDGPDNYSLSRVLGTETTIRDLTPGDYTVELISEIGYSLPAMNKPIYGAGPETQTLAKNSTAVFTMVCTQLNAGVRFVFDESVTDFYPNIKAMIAEKLTPALYLDYAPVNETAGDIAYFTAGKTVTISLKDDETPVNIGGETSMDFDLAAKELLTITLKTSSQEEGKIVINVTVDTDTDETSPEFGVGDAEGDGSEASPFSVGDAINSMPAQAVWVEGVIVGSTTLTRSYAANNILIGAEVGAAPGKCIVLELPEESEWRSLLNLVDYPENVGRSIRIKGDVAGRSDDFSSDAFAVLSNISDVVIEHVSGKVLKDISYPFGAAVKNTYFNNPLYTGTLKRDMSSLTAEYEMKMNAIWKGEGVYDFAPADIIVGFAHENGIKIHGHALVWYMSTPDWLVTMGPTAKTKEQWEAVLRTYIHDVVNHFETKFPGTVQSWDVVNEAFAKTKVGPTGDDPSVEVDSYIRQCFWTEAIGADYIEKAFLYANEVAPADCKLFYNDYNLEYNHATVVGNTYQERREVLCDYLKELQQVEGIRIDGAGTQMHVDKWVLSNTDKEDALRDSFIDLGEVGLVHISELDIRMDAGTTLSPEVALAQKGLYRQILDMYKTYVPAAKRFGVTLWGVDDGTSHYSTDAPHLFDANFNFKPAYDGVIEYIIANP